VLHGAVQSRLVASAVELKRASESGDWDGVDRALAQAREILSAPPVEVPMHVGSVSDEIARKVALWESICAITAEVQLTHDFSGTPVPRLVGRVVEEALSNSIRHGRASKIHVSVSSESGSFITIIVDDNGAGPQSGSSGGGTAFLDQVSGGNWSLKPTAFGTRLTVVMPTGPS
jgi:two-component sensor histidine kinase